MKKEPEDDFEKGLQEILSPGEKGESSHPPKPEPRKREVEPKAPPEKTKHTVSHRTELIVRIVAALVAVLLLLLFVTQTALR
ncbi:MAG: hypothetical protein ACLFSB_15465 [Chitinispirillaceae bacterium]